MPIVATRPEAAAILDVTEKSIGNWKKEPGFPYRDDGQYDTDAIAEWRAATKSTNERAGAQAAEVRLHTAAEKLRIARIDRESKEIDLELKRGELMPRKLVLEILGLISGNIRGAIGALQRDGAVKQAQVVLDALDMAKKQINDRITEAARNSAK